MNRNLKTAMASLVVLAAGTASADMTFYEHSNFEGRAFTSPHKVEDLRRYGFNDRVSSVVITGNQPWEVCEHVEFGGRCTVLRPGRYRSLGEMHMNDRLSSARPARRDDHDHGHDHGHHHGHPHAPPSQGQIAFFEHGGFQGRAFQASGEVSSFRRFGFNDRASSVIVLGERWEACEHDGFNGRCVILRPGRYPSLGAMGLNDTLSSVRPVSPGMRYDEVRYAPIPEPVYDWRRRPQERFYEAQVTGAQAVFTGPQQQRCWIERERVTVERHEPNVGGAVVGGILGGILGHQIGSGPNRDVATAGGAVIGAVVGANVGRESTVSRPTQRCAAVPPQGRPDYWNVSYRFRGVEHHVQTTFPPGPTLTVNDEGEPRI